MHDVAITIIDALRVMDAEAGIRSDGKATGLWWYGGWRRPDLKKPQTEPAWSQRLAELLGARAEVAYPTHPRQRCDLVLGRTWIEIKGAWKAYWVDRHQVGIYRSYLLHPAVPGLLEKSHTVPHDLCKLARLSSAEADTVMQVVVGFEQVADPMDADIAELVAVTGLGDWQTTSVGWPDPHRTGERVRVWCWWRSVGDEGKQ